MSDIRLHKEHGLNPTLTVCWVCGNETGEIALLGAGYNGEAPKHMIINKEPCQTCKKELEEYIFMLVCGSEMFPEESRTGEIIKIKHEVFKQIMNCEIPKHKIAYCGVDVKEKLKSMVSE